MPKKKKTIKRKRRTRTHIIADLSTNHFEKFAFQNGYSVERFGGDYGYDLNIYTYKANGEIENGFIFVQLKATDSLRVTKTAKSISFQIDKADYSLWNEEFYPVILALYDAQRDKAYWIYFQEYFQDKKVKSTTKSIGLRIPIKNKLTAASLAKFQVLKNDLIAKLNSVPITR